MRRRLQRSSDTRSSRVIPAKAGIQGLNGSRATQKLGAGGSAPAPWVTFFARAKKVTKESTARMARRLPSLLAGIGRSPTRRALGNAPRAQTRGSLSPIPAARLGRAIRGLENTSACQLEVVCSPPRVASRAPNEAASFRESSDRARAALWAAGELGERPADARRAGNRAVCAR